jgi:hypothetical protein
MPGELSTLINPLWFSTTFLTMDNPTPVPLYSALAMQAVEQLKDFVSILLLEANAIVFNCNHMIRVPEFCNLLLH